MRCLIAVLLLLTLSTVAAPPPVPAIAKFCGNVVVPVNQLRQQRKMIYREGCQKVETVPVSDGYVLVYGVKVLIGESVP